MLCHARAGSRLHAGHVGPAGSAIGSYAGRGGCLCLLRRSNAVLRLAEHRTLVNAAAAGKHVCRSFTQYAVCFIRKHNMQYALYASTTCSMLYIQAQRAEAHKKLHIYIILSRKLFHPQ